VITSDQRRTITTPEGVPLEFTLADVGHRAAAFLVDGLIIVLVGVGLAFLFVFLGAVGGEAFTVLLLLSLFVLRNFYFTWFELRWHGATPAKRLLGLRVIARHGGPLSADAVFVRNLMRELEVFVPLVAILAPEAVLPGSWALTRFVSAVWLGVVVLLPFFNKDHLRAGDLVGGTVVVAAPRTVLLEDLSSEKPSRAAFSFTKEQLDLYGIYELNVLEDLLRRPTPHETHNEVARRIQAKIGWTPGPEESSETFLREFYTAQRARLEQRMLLGERRERKRSGRLNRRP
jgi:uncharacterized RDD family membrane protein YckC